MKKIKNISLLGFGNVGRGFYEIFSSLENSEFQVIAIAERHPEKLPAELRHLFRHSADLVSDRDSDLIVEATNTSEEAFQLVITALQASKTVVSANKKMLAHNLAELHPFIKAGRLKFEAAACASIPVFRILNGFYSHEPVSKIRGIFNGTCNYLLSRLENEESELPALIADAQALGFAEADPTDDIDGHDTLYKLILLAYQTWGIILKPSDIDLNGIRQITRRQVIAASAAGKRLKLVAEADFSKEQLIATVAVHEVDSNDPLYHISAENNLFQIFGQWSGPQFYAGKGAGALPTGKAMLQDVLDYGTKSNTLHKFSKISRILLN